MPAAHQPRASQKPSRSIVSTVIRALSRLRPVRRQRLPLRPQRFHLHSGSNSSELLTVTPSAMRTTASSFVPNFYLSVCSSCAEAFEDLPGTSVPFAIHAPPSASDCLLYASPCRVTAAPQRYFVLSLLHSLLNSEKTQVRSGQHQSRTI